MVQRKCKVYIIGYPHSAFCDYHKPYLKKYVYLGFAVCSIKVYFMYVVRMYNREFDHCCLSYGPSIWNTWHGSCHLMWFCLFVAFALLAWLTGFQASGRSDWNRKWSLMLFGQAWTKQYSMSVSIEILGFCHHGKLSWVTVMLSCKIYCEFQSFARCNCKLNCTK